MPLALWFVSVLLQLPDYSFDTMRAWAAIPWHAALVSLLVFCIAWHSQLGVQVVIEDYVHGKTTQSQTLVFNTIVHVLLGAAGIFAALSVAIKD